MRGIQWDKEAAVIDKSSAVGQDLLETARTLLTGGAVWDFSFSLLDTVGARGTDEASTITHAVLGGSRTFTRFGSFHPHGLTHLHLPWALNWQAIMEDKASFERLQKLPPLEAEKHKILYRELENRILGVPDRVCLPVKGSQSSRELIAEKSTHRVFPCVILNFSEKRQYMESVLLNESLSVKTVGGSRHHRVLSPNLVSEDMTRILVNLCITVDDICAKLDVASDGVREKVAGKVVILFTGWNSVFRPDRGMRNLNNPFFECWHPFLLHPFLDSRSVRLLVEAGVAGVGTDTYGSECPLYFADPENCYPAVSAVLRSLAVSKRAIESDGRRAVLPYYPPINLNVLGAKLDLVENLRIPAAFFQQGMKWAALQLTDMPGIEPATVKQGVVALLPFATASILDEQMSYDSVLTKVLFWERPDRVEV